jgi:hypothetical protein
VLVEVRHQHDVPGIGPELTGLEHTHRTADTA